MRADDVAVGDAAGQPNLLAESLQQSGVGLHRIGFERFDRDGFVQLLVERPVHHAHASLTEHLLNHVAPRKARPNRNHPRRIHVELRPGLSLQHCDLLIGR